MCKTFSQINDYHSVDWWKQKKNEGNQQIAKQSVEFRQFFATLPVKDRLDKEAKLASKNFLVTTNFLNFVIQRSVRDSRITMQSPGLSMLFGCDSADSQVTQWLIKLHTKLQIGFLCANAPPEL